MPGLSRRGAAVKIRHRVMVVSKAREHVLLIGTRPRWKPKTI